MSPFIKALTRLLVLSASFHLTSATKCKEIQYEDALNPDKANGKWDIIDFTKCYVRAQNPKDFNRGGNGKYWDSRVIDTHWGSTEGSVIATVNDPYNVRKTNDRLWFMGGRGCLVYWGILKPCGLGEGTIQGGMYGPHDGKDGIYTVVSLILPSGVAKLKRIDPNPYHDEQETDYEAKGARDLGIFGINGDIDGNKDLAWGSMFHVVEGLGAKYMKSQKQYQFFTAERTDENDCVVIDLRNVEH